MPRNAELTAIVRPDLDDRAAEREVSKVEEMMDSATRVAPNIDTRKIQRKLERALPGGSILGGAVDRLRGGSGGRTAGQSGGDTSQTALLSAQLETLDDIHETLEKQAATTSGGGGGGSLAGTALKFAGLRPILKGGGGGLLGSLGGTAAGAATGATGLGAVATILGGLGVAGGLGQLEDQGLIQDSGVPDWLTGQPPWWDAKPSWLEDSGGGGSSGGGGGSGGSSGGGSGTTGGNINPDKEEVERRARQIQAAQEMEETGMGGDIVVGSGVANITPNNYGRHDQQGNFQSDQRLFNQAEQNRQEQAGRRRNRAAQKKAQGTTINVDVGDIVAEVKNEVDGRKIESEIERKVEEVLNKELQHVGP